jgi:hypothetical protein
MDDCQNSNGNLPARDYSIDPRAEDLWRNISGYNISDIYSQINLI